MPGRRRPAPPAPATRPRRACPPLPPAHPQVWSQDDTGRTDICGYGFCHVPTAPGMYQLDCPTWVPEGSATERLAEFFVGGKPRMKMEEVVYTSGDRWAPGRAHLPAWAGRLWRQWGAVRVALPAAMRLRADVCVRACVAVCCAAAAASPPHCHRFRLQTTASGVVKLQLGVVMKDFDKNNVLTG